ncbi:hypothetical protein [Luteolibacter luteus]|uniref:DUF2066 domain-containing protein n=1 Tax=Luteolibacter luteus TaxID=2728835 RepID=A0A858RMV2_9BACT|nr:hypothetical protein [Luteolibacter luteus]QJE97689.1 hypothetical protein HHL09_18515 [Luteolibacter luteus]
MKRSIFYLAALAAPLHAAPLDPAQIPAAAKWLVHADIEAMRASETGKAIFTRIETDHGAQLKAAKRMFSINPIADLNGITLFGDGKPEHAVALIHGNFDRTHLEELVAAADDYSKGTYSDLTVHNWEDKGSQQHAAFANDHLLVFSRQESLLHQALDTLKAGSSADPDPFFAAEGGKPLLAGSANLSGIDLPGDEARLLRMAKSLHLAANENAGRFTIRVGANTEDATQADRLRRMLDGVVAFAQAGDAKLDGLDLQSNVAVTGDKTGLDASVSLPVNEWITVMEKAADQEAKKQDKKK